MAKAGLAREIEQIHAHDHACLIYETREQQLQAALPYIRSGLRNNELCVYIADGNTADKVLDELRSAGVDIEDAIAEGRLQVTASTGSYLVDGHFDVDRMMQFLDAGTSGALAAGFSAIRICGEMSWVLAGNPGVERLFEYESRLNEYAVDHPASGI